MSERYRARLVEQCRRYVVRHCDGEWGSLLKRLGPLSIRHRNIHLQIAVCEWALLNPVHCTYPFNFPSTVYLEMRTTLIQHPNQSWKSFYTLPYITNINYEKVFKREKLRFKYLLCTLTHSKFEITKMHMYLCSTSQSTRNTSCLPGERCDLF